MHKPWTKGVVLAAIPLVLLAGCGTNGQAKPSVDLGSYDAPAAAKHLEMRKAELKQYADQAQKSEEGPLLTERADGRPLSAGTPFVDLDAALVDQTGLGAHDAAGEAIDGGVLDGGVPYYWHAKNGTGDLLFSAIVRGDRVISVNRFNTGRDYWAVPGKVFGRDLPDVYASGAMVVQPDAANPEDPTDYADPEDYADNNEGSFTGDATEDAWQKAYNYWCDHHGAQ